MRFYCTFALPGKIKNCNTHIEFFKAILIVSNVALRVCWHPAITSDFNSFCLTPWYWGWNNHVKELMAEGGNAFAHLYWMKVKSFTQLCDIICSEFEVDKKMSTRRACKGPITVAIMLHYLLQWLWGRSYLNIRLCAGISPASFYRCIYKCIDEILKSDIIYKFPSTTAGFEAAAKEFEALSLHGTIKGCIACLYCFLLQI